MLCPATGAQRDIIATHSVPNSSTSMALCVCGDRYLRALQTAPQKPQRNKSKRRVEFPGNEHFNIPANSEQSLFAFSFFKFLLKMDRQAPQTPNPISVLARVPPGNNSRVDASNMFLKGLSPWDSRMAYGLTLTDFGPA